MSRVVELAGRHVIRRQGIGAAFLVAGVAWVVAAVWIGRVADGAVAGPDRPVNAGARDPADLRAHNSPTVTRNPRDPATLVVANRVDSPDFSCAIHRSTDGGTSWSPVEIPTPEGRGPKCYGPDAAFGADGTLHVSFVTLTGRANQPEVVWVASSRDGGRTLASPRRVSGPLGFQVRIAADPHDPHRVVLTWLQARDIGALKFTAPGNPILVSRSSDGGATWSRPARASSPSRGRALAPSVAFGPRGEIYVLYLDVGDDRLDYEGAHENAGGPPYPGRFKLVLARSRDRGSTWEESVVDDRIVPVERFIPFLPPFPSLAVNPRSGRIHVGFHDRRLGDADVWVWSLAPGAAAWTRPVRVNDTARHDRTTQHLPQLAIAPDGRLDVVYYDRRGDPRADVRTEVSLQSSRDQGQSFGARTKLSSRPFDSRIGFGAERGLATLGSRLGLVAGDDSAVVVWSDTRAATEASNKQDLVRTVAEFQAPGDVAILRFGGLALALAGLAILAAARRRRIAA